MSWTMISALSKKDIQKAISHYSKMKQQKTITEIMEETGNVYFKEDNIEFYIDAEHSEIGGRCKASQLQKKRNLNEVQ